MNLQQNGKEKGLYVSVKWLIHVVITIVFTIFASVSLNKMSDSNWTSTISIIVVIMLCYQMISLVKSGKRYFSFEIGFILMSYLFMFGQIVLDGFFGITQIEALGYHRAVIDSRYDSTTMFHASVFILLCIQWIFLAFVVRKNKEIEITEKHDPAVFSAAVPLIVIGLPCHILYSIQMIIMAQAGGSYNAILDQTGLIDDFANFFIYGLICLIFSNKLSKNKIKTILIFVTLYLVVIMALTGDRRYQIVSIIVLFLAYLKCYNVKIGINFVGLAVVGYLFLSLFYVLREIREDSLVSIGGFLSTYGKMIVGTRTSILTQTLYEFGGSFYTVCLAVKFMPSIIGYKYGLTILSGLISIIPLGFLYQNSNVFQNGRLAAQLMQVGVTTVGGSVYADLYGNFGFVFGIVASAILGIILFSVFNKSENSKHGVCFENARYYILFYALIHLARASFTEVIRTATWGLIILYIAYYLKTRRSNEAITNQE